MDTRVSDLQKLADAFKEAEEPNWVEKPSGKSPHSKDYLEWVEDLKSNRQYIFHYLMDMFGTWFEAGDSLPNERMKLRRNVEAEIKLHKIS